MARDAGMKIVGTIRTIELHAVGANFRGITPRQVARIQLDVERAIDGDGGEISVENLNGMHFQGPAELVPRFSEGERVQIVTANATGIQIGSIRAAPVS